MKKLSLLLVVLLAAGSAGLYGQMAIGTNFEISGNATATAGYNLDEEKFGFKNESESSIKIELVAEQSSTNAGDMPIGWYGSIELNDFQIVIDSDDEDSTEFVVTESMMMDDGTSTEAEKDRTDLYVVAPDIVATLKNGPLWLRIFDAPENKADKIEHIEDDEDGDYDAVGDDDGSDVGLDLDGHGIAVGYDTADLDFSIGITSDLQYDSTDEGSFVISADLDVDVGPAGLALSFVQGLPNEDDPDANKDDTGVGALLTTDFGDVVLSAGADVELTGDADDADTTDNEAMMVDVGANATITLTPNSSLTSKYLYSTVKSVASDVEVEIADDNGLVENLKMSLKWGLFDITGGDSDDSAAVTENDQADLFVKGSLDYDLEGMGGTITPGTTVSVDQVDGGDAIVKLEVRAVLTDAIPATEFGLKWKTDQLVDSGELASQSGIVTLWTKITY